jgi:hypothetical protein
MAGAGPQAYLAQQQQRVQPPALEDEGAAHNRNHGGHNDVGVTRYFPLNVPDLQARNSN